MDCTKCRDYIPPEANPITGTRRLGGGHRCASLMCKDPYHDPKAVFKGKPRKTWDQIVEAFKGRGKK